MRTVYNSFMISNVMRNRIDRSAYSTMVIFAASVNILPIALVKISEEFSINLTQAGIFGFVTSIEQFFVLILSIFAAARFGKIRMLRFALLVISAGLLAFSFSKSYTAAVCLIIIFGFGTAIIEAMITPMVNDLHPGDGGSKMNLLHAFWPIGVCSSVLISGELLSRGVSWRLLFIGSAIVTIIIYFSYPGSKKIKLPPSRADFGHLGDILKRPRFWMLGMAMFFAGAGELSFAFWSASYIQIQFDTLPRAGGFGAAAFALGMMVGRMAAVRLSKRYGLKKIIMTSAVAGALFSLTFFAIQSPLIIYIYLFIAGILLACHWPSIQSYSATVMDVDATALMVFLSCFGIPGTSAAVLTMGIIGDAYSLQAAYVVAPVFILLIAVFMFLEGRVERTVDE